MKICYLILTILFSTFGTLEAVTNSSQEEITDYYWREYTGFIPSDAIIAGTDKSGKPIYIGQGFFKNIGLLPATIYKGSKSVSVTAIGKTHTADKNVKVNSRSSIDPNLPLNGSGCICNPS
ncbi:hypothetical protein ILUMI_18322 [Ignelater luminosus]|uniref:Uncharacterized protein n=1 Tax=Ignelater luminosus TaxID=2038154 RepID=A0A8K0G6N7_IGNLU|nr:hypothetical protein ILUMI_18322 [Ignelater luminosus]